ncbi:proline-rich protein 7 isoform X4 [Rosa chinensis]|uniref:proline-rich protein 7 isoform X4 n=1 Tax=Rosa chinensis TaxID=74649 RepID=UPI000D08BBB5|nr:proline-rich protein 7 isoform X4 [Rosa chinensis]
MDPPHGCRSWRPCLLHHPHHHLHHHHHHHPLFLNPHHHPHHHHHHFNCRHHHVRPNFTSFAQNPEQATPVPFPTYSKSETSGIKGAYDYNPTPLVLQEQNHDDVALEEEEDDDPIFVLTDEWKEFFAKSEAKRKLERKQAKKGKK